jgi:hypothetical protein
MLRNVGQKFWQWTTKPRPYWTKNVREGAITFTVFGVTGSSSVYFVRPAVEKVFGIKGTLIDGPNEYRIVSLLCVSPIYALILGVTGTLAGRHTYFAKMSAKILGRFLPKKASEKLLCRYAKNGAKQT